jgi:hypothetical protein
MRGEWRTSRNGSPTPAVSSMNQQSCTVITLRKMGSRSGFGLRKAWPFARCLLAGDEAWRCLWRGRTRDGDDADRVRLTFRYRSRSWCVTFEEKLDDIPRG